ncbi:hypothetical protein ElyMa_001252000 [Elysia marginata]|uniref:Uncharacterized protein n=1 Tax=Elysia marginata TaxID=1093978 RepID=A0AAV4IG74_9GAST|nr:hypothetical protein ElyMa_001252000 [Elysia marginata]
MSSANSKLRNHWKEHDPDKYKAYLEYQRINSKRRRDEKKQKWAEEVHTRAMIEERERQKEMKRERDRRYREKKAAEAGRQIRKRRETLPVKAPEKKRCEMTVEEKRQHDNNVRTQYNHNLSHQKKTANRKKDRERKRAARQSKKQTEGKKDTVEGVLNIVKRLPKTLLNVGSEVFYTSSEVSRPLPHKRYAKKHGPAYAMTVTQRGAHMLFCATFPDFKIKYSKFSSLRPKNVRRLDKIDIETCLCLCCQNLRYKIDVINKNVDPRDKLPPEGKILDMLLCQKTGPWHNITCVRGEVLMVEDFAENRKASFSSEVKSAYFSKEQITLHPIVTYYKDGAYQLVLEVMPDKKELYISCMRQKPAGSSQHGEVWVFPDAPDESTVHLEKDDLRHINEPEIDPIKLSNLHF